MMKRTLSTVWEVKQECHLVWPQLESHVSGSLILLLLCCLPTNIPKPCRYWSWSYTYISAKRRIHKYKIWIARINSTSLGLSLHTSLGWTQNEVQHLLSLGRLERKHLIAIQPDKDGEGLAWGILSRRVEVRLDLPPWLSSKTSLASSSRFQSHRCCCWFQRLSLFLRLSLAFSTYRWDNLRTYLKQLL